MFFEPVCSVCSRLGLRKNMDRMVEIAVFSYPADAQTLMALLRSEGIECFLRNELTTQIMAGYVDVGGARLEILEKDLPHAIEIMRENGYPLPSDGTKEYTRRLKLLDICFPFLKKQRPEVRILVAFASVAVVLALAIFALSLLMSN